jgi:hypothetical protein
MGESTPRSSALTRLGRAVERAAAALFARSDARATASGWEVRTAGRWSTSRVYHDPRYDRVAVCPSCAGDGCPRCAGTGRITRTDPNRPARNPASDWVARDWTGPDRTARDWTAQDRTGRDRTSERLWSRP